jgi:3-phenylpropionate/trans-cinnamate dioxygenase ferredoxin reductase subunit
MSDGSDHRRRRGSGVTLPRNVLVAGAGLAGARAAETLRAEGFEGRVILAGDEPTAPYERPALSKEYLAGAKGEHELLLRPPAFWHDCAIELRLGERVASVDPSQGTAVLSCGEELAWDVLVIATGARPRSLPFPVPRGVHSLRTLADARALREALVPGARLVVIGGGFVGAEVASTATALGLEVTMLETLHTPFERTLGRAVGRLLAERYRSHGVDLRVGATAAGFRADESGTLRAVELAGGDEIPCEAALVGIGIEPARELVPERSSSRPVYTCGDVTASGGHWTSAAAGGAAVARRILDIPATAPQPPFFWSDQFGLRLQLVGDTTRATGVRIEGAPDSFIARYHEGSGRLVAALAANRPAEVAAIRKDLATPASGRALARR